jgi:hypothetical protein
MCSPKDGQDADFAIYLDYGVDSCFGKSSDITVHERGIVFRSRWQFPLETQLAIRLCTHPEKLGESPECEEITGIVVSCERLEYTRPWFETALIFVDVTQRIQKELDRLADQLVTG